MGIPIRIKYCENVDHFVEAQGQLPPAQLPISERTWKIFAVTLVGGAFLSAIIPEYLRRRDLKFLLSAVLFFTVVMAFWIWLFKKIGWDKSGKPSKYQWTEKDRARFEKAYIKQTGRKETTITCEFTQQGFALGPENDPPTAYDWTNIQRIVERQKGLLIFVRKSVYFWFPKRVFDPPESYRQLLDLAEKKVKHYERLKLAIVALGSNLGDLINILKNAMERLQSFSDEPVLKSSLWETTPVDCPPGSPKFVNGVVGLVPRAGETPESLLQKLQGLEKEFGRVSKKVLNEPRPLDLDLIAFGNEMRSSPELTLPHPRAHLRRFVLQPLSEIAPDLILPGQTKSVIELLSDLPVEQMKEVWPATTKR